MTADLESWLGAVSTMYGESVPDMKWTEEIDDETLGVENAHFQSFHNFANFPNNFLGIDMIVEAKILSDTSCFLSRAETILFQVKDLHFSQVANFALLSYALRQDICLISKIPNDCPKVILVWCLCQIIIIDPLFAMKIWHERLFHPPPISDRIELHAVLLFLELCLSKWEPSMPPPITSDEFEVIFALGYCTKRGNVQKLARFIIPLISTNLSSSSASHLLFRRLLPYCSMENNEGRYIALSILEEIIGHHARFPSCISTWISLHRMFYDGSKIRNRHFFY